MSTRYTSLMENIDGILETDNIEITVVHPTFGPANLETGENILNGYGDYRAARMNGDIVLTQGFCTPLTKNLKYLY